MQPDTDFISSIAPKLEKLLLSAEMINYLSNMQIKTEQWNDWILISLGGQFVVRNLASVRPVFESAESRDTPLVALDLAGCTHLDSSAITLIVNHYKKLLSKGGKLVVFGANPDIKEIFSIVGLDRLIPVFSSKDEFKKANDNAES